MCGMLDEEKEGSAAQHKIKKKKKYERQVGKGCLAKDQESPPWE